MWAARVRVFYGIQIDRRSSTTGLSLAEIVILYWSRENSLARVTVEDCLETRD